MLELKHMNIVESVWVDPDRMVELSVALGDAAAESLIMQAMNELADSMSVLEAAYLAKNPERMEREAGKFKELSEHVGMSTMARVAWDVQECLHVNDEVALGATMSRLRRATDRLSTAFWEIQDIPG